MSTLFHSGTFSNRISKKSAPSSPLVVHTAPGSNFVVHTVPGANFELNKEKGAGKKMNTPTVRRDTSFSPGMLLDYTIFSYILAVDAVLTAEVFLRDRLQTKNRLPA